MAFLAGYPRTQGRGEGKIWHVLCEFTVWIISCDCHALCNIVFRAIYKEVPLHLDIMWSCAKKTNINWSKQQISFQFFLFRIFSLMMKISSCVYFLQVLFASHFNLTKVISNKLTATNFDMVNINYEQISLSDYRLKLFQKDKYSICEFTTTITGWSKLIISRSFGVIIDGKFLLVKTLF